MYKTGDLIISGSKTKYYVYLILNSDNKYYTTTYIQQLYSSTGAIRIHCIHKVEKKLLNNRPFMKLENIDYFKKWLFNAIFDKKYAVTFLIKS